MKKPTYTKAQARRALNAKNDSDLARKMGTVRQTVSSWGGDDDPIPEVRCWQVRELERSSPADHPTPTPS